MAADRKCCVPGCEKTREDTVLHKFPNPQKYTSRFRTWSFAIGGNILVLEDMYVYNYRRVCHSHFEKRYWTRSKMLSKNAVPTLHLKGYSSKRKYIPESQIETQCKDEFEQNSQTFDAWESNREFQTLDVNENKSKNCATRLEIDVKDSSTCTENIMENKEQVPHVLDIHGCNDFGQFVSNELLRFDIDRRYVVRQKIIELLKTK